MLIFAPTAFVFIVSAKGALFEIECSTQHLVTNWMILLKLIINGTSIGSIGRIEFAVFVELGLILFST